MPTGCEWSSTTTVRHPCLIAQVLDKLLRHLAWSLGARRWLQNREDAASEGRPNTKHNRQSLADYTLMQLKSWSAEFYPSHMHTRMALLELDQQAQRPSVQVL